MINSMIPTSESNAMPLCRILPRSTGLAFRKLPLFSASTLRQVESRALALLPPGTLMQRAGLAIGHLARAVQPHAKVIWVACGPGNNGGDGFEAAMHLANAGVKVFVSSVVAAQDMPPDAARAYQRARTFGVQFGSVPPSNYDLCIDAMFGIGRLRPIESHYAQWIERMNGGSSPVLAVDVPSGLNADTGVAGTVCVQADFTLSLLGLKPGLFTGDGRAACGEIWFDSLWESQQISPVAWLNPCPKLSERSHKSHKGSFGDVVVIGGAAGMYGASVLAASAALHCGAGRVYVATTQEAQCTYHPPLPELMFRHISEINYASQVIVAGCGGGTSIEWHLQKILLEAKKLVLDADALNAIACCTALQILLTARVADSTVLTPHPLEAARLLQVGTLDIQSNRLSAAQHMADRFRCTVVLKGSGSIVAAPDATPYINPTGNARLATAGTGDVLAGSIGARLAHGQASFDAACEAVFIHGQVADQWSHPTTLTAMGLARMLWC